MTKRAQKILVFPLALATLFTCTSFFAKDNGAIEATPVFADTYEVNAEKVQTENDGLFLNNTNNSGIQFKTSYDKAYIEELKETYKSVRFGTLILPTSYVTEGNDTHGELNGSTVLDIQLPDFAGEHDGSYYAYANIVGIKPDNYLEDFVGIGYIKATAKDGSNTYIYSAASDAVNLYELARAAYESHDSYTALQNRIVKSYLDSIVEVQRNSDGTMSIVNTLDGYTAPEGRTISYDVNTLEGTITGDNVYGVYAGNNKFSVTSQDNTHTFVYTASSTRAAGNVYNFSYDCIGGTDVMPIVGFGGFDWTSVGPDGQTLQNNNWASFNAWAAAYKELGVNTVVHSVARFDSSGTLANLLNACKTNGIAYYLQSSNVDNYVGVQSNLSSISWDAVHETINNSNYSNLVGVTLRDEPGLASGKWKDDIDTLVQAKSEIEKGSSAAMADRSYYVNLLPTGNIFKTETEYKNHIKYYVEKLDPSFLSFDRYPFRAVTVGNNNIDQKSYIADLSVMNEQADLYSIPFWSYIQCGCDWNDDGKGGQKPADTWEKRPTQQEFRWLVNVTLAYGAKGIEYYELNQNQMMPESKNDGKNYRRNGIFGYDGKKNEWYNYALEANNTIKSIDQVLMNATHEGLMVGDLNGYTTSWIPNSDKLTSYHELQSVKGKAFVGCFNYKGKTALYVVYDDGITDQKDVADTTNGSVTLNFNSRYGYTMIKGTAPSQGIIPSGNALTLNGLKPGEGVLIVLD